MDVDLSSSLKRCLSVPIINNPQSTNNPNQTPRKDCNVNSAKMATTSSVPQSSNPSSREVSPSPVFNIFAPRARRYSANFSSLGLPAGSPTTATVPPIVNGPRLTPRISQLRKEECIDMNSREMNHEREVHSAMQMSQSWEDLTLVAENWSCKSEDISNPLQVALPIAGGVSSCSSPSPTSSRAGLRLPYGLSPSPTRRTFATRRSMSPIAMRPSQLGPVKRRFELDDSSWSTCSPPPLKKIFTESRGSSPICQSPSSICPSPDSGTYEGRITPKLFISKLCTANAVSSTCSSPLAPSPGIDGGIDLQSNASSCSPANTTFSQPMCTEEPALSDGDSMPKSQGNEKSIAAADNDDTQMNDCISSSQGDNSSSSLESKPNFMGKLPKSISNPPRISSNEEESVSSSSTSSSLSSSSSADDRLLRINNNCSVNNQIQDSSDINSISSNRNNRVECQINEEAQSVNLNVS